ncbi:MAG: 5'/3'-nucleotidase SurE [Gammaproteobacteria bacterium]|nr:5'/3'-nucleotidase SurE [Gammaproteobacteria bacterium]|tara:strand:+ start:16095 stop:16850 length:756 start_codon:yes stop_codon:yes gene_type:complete
MKILLTNDDGYDAINIKSLYKELSKNHEVWMIAPKNNCSGMSAAISYLSEIEVTKIEDRIYAVDGTPADCTYLGLLSIVDFEFDIVISGINHGANIGNDVLYSGTVGAAIGGRNLKFPPVALSVASYDAKDLNFLTKKSVELIEKILRYDENFMGKVININFPDISEKEYKGCVASGLSKRGIPARPILIEENKSPNDVYKYRYNASGEPLLDSLMTDAEAVKNGFVSFSILDYSLNSQSFLEEISKFLDE